MVTPYSNKTDDELLRIVFMGDLRDTLTLELAYRLEALATELELLNANVDA